MIIFNKHVIPFVAHLTAVLVLLALSAPRPTRAADPLFPHSPVDRSLLPRDQWHPYHTAAERQPWDQLPADTRNPLIAAGEKNLGHAWEPLPAIIALDFVRNGNRTRYEKLSFARREALANLVLAECVEGKGRFMDDITNGIWAICEESFWGIPAHLGPQKAGAGLPDVTDPVVELFGAETGALLAWTDYLLAPQLDKVSPLLRKRIALEIQHRILEPALARNDFGWMGLHNEHMSNWTPWICSNWLVADLLTEPDPTRRAAAATKIVGCLDRFLQVYAPDGGCEEGPGYWNAAGGCLFDALDLFHSASAGKLNALDEPLVKEIGRYIYRAHIAGNWFINGGDAPARESISAPMVFRYATRIGDPVMASFAASVAREEDISHLTFPGTLTRALPAVFQRQQLLATAPHEPLLRDVWLPGIQLMAARDQDGSAAGLFLAATAGHNGKSHNHNDVGNFTVYLDGQPALIDVGVETYTAKTFSASRYDIWTMQSAYHNLPTINGTMEHEGANFAARNVQYTHDDAAATLVMDIAGAFPPAAAVQTWNRTIRLLRGKEVTVTDVFTLTAARQPIVLNLMTAMTVAANDPGSLILATRPMLGKDIPQNPARLTIDYDKSQLQANVETIKIPDARLQTFWGDELIRIQLTARAQPLIGEFALHIHK